MSDERATTDCATLVVGCFIGGMLALSLVIFAVYSFFTSYPGAVREQPE